MTEREDRLQRPPPRHVAGIAVNELAAMRGRNLGPCGSCGRPVFVAHNHTRIGGRVLHVRCPMTARAPSPTGALASVPDSE